VLDFFLVEFGGLVCAAFSAIIDQLDNANWVCSCRVT